MAEGDGVVNNGGIELHLTNSSDELTKVLGLRKLNMPQPQVEETETTDQDSGVRRPREAVVAPHPLLQPTRDGAEPCDRVVAHRVGPDPVGGVAEQQPERPRAHRGPGGET